MLDVGSDASKTCTALRLASSTQRFHFVAARMRASISFKPSGAIAPPFESRT